MDRHPDLTVHGPGEPAVAVVGGIHGDELAGVRAVERLRTAIRTGDLDLKRGLILAVANPPAVAAGRRALDSDMNRTFPGDSAGDSEERLAANLAAALDGVMTLSLHATRSAAEPFGLFDAAQPRVLEVARQLPVGYLVEHTGGASGSLSEVTETLTLETGLQGTPAAADTAERLTLEFLRATGVLDGAPTGGSPRYFALSGPVMKPPAERYELLVENFTPVERGTVFARADGEPIRAEESFYPVLMSADGYETLFGFTGRWLGDDWPSAKAALSARRGVDPAASDEPLD